MSHLMPNKRTLVSVSMDLVGRRGDGDTHPDLQLRRHTQRCAPKRVGEPRSRVLRTRQGSSYGGRLSLS